ncbi:protein-tyrosine phosphatase family protein [Cyanobium sp. ULC082]
MVRLEAEGVKAVLSLSSEDEAPLPSGIQDRFAWERLVLPDHRSTHMVQPEELASALHLLAGLRTHGSVFVHCVAAMERSPLVCLAWLMHDRHLSREQALDYLMQVHPGTNPLPGQLEALQQLVMGQGQDFFS